MSQANQITVRIQRRRAANVADRARLKVAEREVKKLKARIAKREKMDETDEQLVQHFADPRRDELTEGGKTRKFFRFNSGAVGQWYYPSEAALVVGDDFRAITKALLQLPDWELYLDIRLRKRYIKTHLKALQKASPTLRRGLGLEEKRERFRINT